MTRRVSPCDGILFIGTFCGGRPKPNRENARRYVTMVSCLETSRRGGISEVTGEYATGLGCRITPARRVTPGAIKFSPGHLPHFLVYCISCKRCGQQYVGQTKNSLKQRFQSHFYYIAHDVEKTEVSGHFNREGHNGLNDVSIHVLGFIHHCPQRERAMDMHLSKEFDRIQRIRSRIPHWYECYR